MTTSTLARAAYVQASIATADPQRLLVMLCDRMVLDVQRALACQQAGEHLAAGEQLIHAQDIALELRSSLDPSGFEGGVQLAAIYEHLFAELVRANVRRDPEITQHCASLATQIADTWRQAALALALPA
ncbi:flagellar protein FliS [Nocardioides scoriae]|uniref:Flagellar protein FliS n=1 Tax=Nocardioides scoriae TaxID=642780 RepID=A0A1H1S5I4_9ACTN|nr:flagellar export chaperone FliS [Nocardioides scoriae]SDS43224.1 flagellar protein FliS [Nocardioides scoriae]